MISVIIPLYNVENYIEACLKSFEFQSYSDFEIVIVNDGSTDGSYNIVKNYMERTQLNINLINQENGGVSNARNKGIQKSTGDYLCFVDSDDLVTSKYLINMLTILEEAKCDMVICATTTVDEEFILSRNDDETFLPINREIMTKNEALNKFLENEFTTGVWSLLVKKDVIVGNELKFSEGYKYSEDLEMVWKMINSSSLIALTAEPLYIYRVRSGSAMSYVDSRRLDGFKLMQNLELYFERTNPIFYVQFKKYGLARWVWSTLWQVAVASPNFKVFTEYINNVDSSKYMKELIDYPRVKIKCSAFLFLISPYIFYKIAKFLGKARLKRTVSIT